MINITIYFSTGRKNGFMTRAIKWWTKSKISHNVIVYEDKTFGPMVLTANAEGFVIIPWDRWSKQNILLYKFKLVGPSTDEALKWIIQTYVGTKYDYGSFWTNAIRLRFHYIWKLAGKWLRKTFLDNKEVICSESVVRFLNRAGYKCVKGLDPELISSEELLQVLKKASNTEIIEVRK